jgi:hypothetical protein
LIQKPQLRATKNQEKKCPMKNPTKKSNDNEKNSPEIKKESRHVKPKSNQVEKENKWKS